MCTCFIPSPQPHPLGLPVLQYGDGRNGRRHIGKRKPWGQGCHEWDACEPSRPITKLCSLLWFFFTTDVSISNRQNSFRLFNIFQLSAVHAKDVLENVEWNFHVEYFSDQ